MNKKQKFEQLLNHGKVDDGFLFQPILMHFAARHSGKTYREFASDYRSLVESNLKCLEDFDMDAVGLISDPYRETSAFGAKVSFPEETVPVCHNVLIKSMNDIELLKNPDVYESERTRDRIKAAEMFYKEIGNSVPIIGWIEGPLAEACDLAGVSEILLSLMMNPDFVKKLVEKVMKTALDFAKAQIEAGCDIIGVGDAICSQIDAETYRTIVKDKHAAIFEFIHRHGAKVKLHICGNITHLLPDIKDTRPDIVDIDHLVNMEEAYNMLGPDIVRCGNLDPVSVIQQKSREDLADIVRTLCSKEKDRRFIISGGCEISVQTSPENLMVLRTCSRYF
ncbi:MAG: uroporphyrinogen decarboxylase family protein [Prolixibacteraceae bacterium]